MGYGFVLGQNLPLQKQANRQMVAHATHILHSSIGGQRITMSVAHIITAKDIRRAVSTSLAIKLQPLRLATDKVGGDNYIVVMIPTTIVS